MLAYIFTCSISFLHAGFFSVLAKVLPCMHAPTSRALSYVSGIAASYPDVTLFCYRAHMFISGACYMYSSVILCFVHVYIKFQETERSSCL